MNHTHSREYERVYTEKAVRHHGRAKEDGLRRSSRSDSVRRVNANTNNTTPYM